MSESDYLIIPNLSPKISKRISSKIVVDPDTDCWIWIAYRTRKGYGTLTFEHRKELAHRVMYAWLVGPIQRGIGPGIPELDHFICSNPSCVNPAHLRLVPHKANMLRSEITVFAIKARQTHCQRGHLLPTMANRPEGRRRCMICYNEGRREYLRLWQRQYRKTPKYRDWKEKQKLKRRQLIDKHN